MGGTDSYNRANLSSTETAVGLATGTELGNKASNTDIYFEVQFEIWYWFHRSLRTEQYLGAHRS